MQIIVESRDADATPMRELSIARVRFALRRLKALTGALRWTVPSRGRPGS